VEQRRNNPETSFVIIQRVGVWGAKKSPLAGNREGR
jgi:hypothetical protein